MRERVMTCAWCDEPIPPAAVAAYVVRSGEYQLATCGAGCLAELVVIVAGVRLDVGATT